MSEEEIDETGTEETPEEQAAAEAAPKSEAGEEPVALEAASESAEEPEAEGAASDSEEEDVVDLKEVELSPEERDERRQVVEALIFTAEEPISPKKLAGIVPDGSVNLVRELVNELNAFYTEHGRAFEIAAVAGGFQVRTLAVFADSLQKLKNERPLRLSRPALETLAIVAYRQPLTRGEIENVRGVDAGAVLRNLLERKLVRIAGHRDVAGKPMIYATTKRFLELFGLNQVRDLPTLRDLKEIAGPQEELELETQSLTEVLEASAEGSEEEEPGGEEVAVSLDTRADLDLTGQPKIDGNPSGELH